MRELTPILEFKDVSLSSVSSQTSGLKGLSFTLARGEVAVVHLEEGHENIPFAPLAQGLVVPDMGHVYFKGVDWTEMGAALLSAQRGLIRRVYEHYGWITNLDIMENLSLAESYHTRRPMDDIVHEIKGLARRFGIDLVPQARPTRVHGMTLRKLEWVRAFVGNPELILLERPLYGAPKADGAKLIQAVCEAARRGVAVLWMADDLRVPESCDTVAVRQFQMNGDTMVAV